jgi:Putative peptidoglycan binding domain
MGSGPGDDDRVQRPGRTFAASVDAIMAEARSQRIKAVIWLTMRRAEVAYPGRTFVSTSLGFNDNNRILLQKVRPYRGQLQIADWAGHSAGRKRWVTDGIHLTAAGAAAVSQFLADQVGVVLSGVSITPPAPWTRLRVGSRGRLVVAAQRVLIDAGIRLPGGADGIYGPYTEAAVEVYQRRHGIPITGIVYRPTALVMGIYRLPPPPLT